MGKKKNQGSKKEGGSSSSLAPEIPAKVWQPGVDKLEEGEELQCDPSAYNSLHAFHIGWPCLRYLHSCLFFSFCHLFFAFLFGSPGREQNFELFDKQT